MIRPIAVQPSRRLSRDARAARWSARVQLLTFSAAIEGINEPLLDGLCGLYLDTSGCPEVLARDDNQVHLTVDLTDDAGPSSGPAALGYLEDRIDTAALGHLFSSHVIVHAGAICRNGRTIVLPAASGAGKSTLVAAAALSGWSCLSDEVAIIDIASRSIWPFRKCICLKSGGWHLIRASFDTVTASAELIRPDRSHVWFLEPPVIPAATVPQPVTHVVVPIRQPGARATLSPLTASAGLTELVRHSINLPRHGATGFDVLATLAAGATCATLVYDDVGEALAALAELTGG